MHGSVCETEGVSVCVCAQAWRLVGTLQTLHTSLNVRKITIHVRTVTFKEVELQSWSYFSLIYEETAGLSQL